MSDLVDKLWERQKEIKQQIKKMEDELTKINALLALYLKSEEVKPVSTAIVRVGSNDKAKIITLVEAILRESAEPVRRDVLLLRLQENGITIIGTNPTNVLTTILWRARDRFTHERGVGYSLIKR